MIVLFGLKHNRIPDSLMPLILDVGFLLFKFFCNKTTPWIWNDSLLSSSTHTYIHIHDRFHLFVFFFFSFLLFFILTFCSYFFGVFLAMLESLVFDLSEMFVCFPVFRACSQPVNVSSTYVYMSIYILHTHISIYIRTCTYTYAYVLALGVPATHP